jgi:CRP-like cAMP-binding protein
MSISPLHLAKYRKHVEPFVQFTDEEWELFAEHLYIKEVKKKECWVTSMHTCKEVGYILSGAFRFFFVRDGVEISNYFCFAGELVSAYGSFLKQQPGPGNIQAMEDATLICFSYNSLQQLLQDERTAFKMESFGRKVAEYLICCYEERLTAFITQTPEQRYMELVKRNAELLQRIPQHYVANYLGVTPESLSRIRKRLANAAKKQREVA